MSDSSESSPVLSRRRQVAEVRRFLTSSDEDEDSDQPSGSKPPPMRRGRKKTAEEEGGRLTSSDEEDGMYGGESGATGLPPDDDSDRQSASKSQQSLKSDIGASRRGGKAKEEGATTTDKRAAEARRLSEAITLPPPDSPPVGHQTLDAQRRKKLEETKKDVFSSSEEEDDAVRKDAGRVSSDATLPQPDVSVLQWKSQIMAASTPKGESRTGRRRRGGKAITPAVDQSSSGLVSASTLLTSPAVPTQPSTQSASQGVETSSSGIISASAGDSMMVQRRTAGVASQPVLLSDSGEEASSSGIIGASAGGSMMVRGRIPGAANQPVLSNSEEELKRDLARESEGENSEEEVVEVASTSLSSSDVEVVEDSSYVSGAPGDKRKRNRMRSQLTGDRLALEWRRDRAVKRLSILQTSAKYLKLDDLPDGGQQLNLSLNESLREVEMLAEDLLVVEDKLNRIPSDDDVVEVEEKSAEVMVWDALPKASVKLSEMGKRALQTHYAQSAVTVEALKSLQGSLDTKPGEGDATTDPVGLNVPLLPHQRRALTWLLWRERQKPAGGILADDMGLGKTLTMISLIMKSSEIKKARGGNDSDSSAGSSPKRYTRGKTLVVCPSSVMGQWVSEIKSKVVKGLLYPVLHHGPKRDAKPVRLAFYDVVVTSYAILQKDDKESGKGPLLTMKWERIILDEAHTIRNHKSMTATAVQKVKARHRWCLTGTPIQNREADFYSLLKFLRCRPFDDWQVWKRWVDNKDKAGIERLNCIRESILLRRTKDSIDDSSLKLKSKTVAIINVRLDDEEKRVYEQVAHFSSTLLARMISEKAEKEQLLSTGNPTYNAKKLYALRDENPFRDHPELDRLHRNMLAMGNVKTHDILVLILRLRQICCHASLAMGIIEEDVSSESNEDKSDAVWQRLVNLSIREEGEEESAAAGLPKTDTVLSRDNPVFKNDRISSKIAEVIRVLKEEVLPKGGGLDKAVVVSQWTSFLEVLHSFLKKEGVWSIFLTGKVLVKDRQAIIDTFNDNVLGARVLLLSLTAGGTGLNLIGANHLLLLDIHWNPQLEAQACDRIYRFGQTKHVFIYKFICSDTIEESIMKLQEHKMQLASAILQGTQAASSRLTIDDLKMLFNVH